MTDSRPEWAPASITLDQPSSARVWDYVFLCGLLHFVAADGASNAVVSTLRDATAPGSHLNVRHTSHDGQSGDIIKMLEMRNRNTDSPEPMYWRTHDQIESLFEGFTLLEPGVVPLPLWRPDPGEPERAAQNPERFASYAAVGVKPAVTG